jgi:hypothetical protein
VRKRSFAECEDELASGCRLGAILYLVKELKPSRWAPEMMRTWGLWGWSQGVRLLDARVPASLKDSLDDSDKVEVE